MLYFLMRGVLVFSLVAIASIGYQHEAQAHPLLPPEVNAYIAQNPDATDADVERFIAENFGSEELARIQAIHESDGDGGIYNVDELSLSERAKLLLDVKNDRLSLSENFARFVSLGIRHILGGLDHVLFVFALVLVWVPWRRLFLMVTTFTIAHSLTLVLAGLGIITLSSRIVEPMVALSIAYMAFTSVFLRNYSFFREFHSRLGVIFFFGLFHGLGFAGVFSEIGAVPADYVLSLVFFNMGVEIGQIFILTLVLVF